MILETASATQIQCGELAISVGNFDGVHRGHQKIIQKLREDAHHKGLTPAIITFPRHPLALLDSDRTPARLTTLPEKMVLLTHQGVMVTYLWDFSSELASIAPQQFMTLLRDKLNVRHVVIGHDHTFGRNREGNWQLMQQIAPRLGLTVDYVDALLDNNHIVSSSHLRKAILRGDIVAANKMLGYRFSHTSTVVVGRGDGRKLGFPTANLAPIDKITPSPGVYVGRAYWGTKSCPAAINISFERGERGTIKPLPGETGCTIVEANLLDFDGALYGKQLRLEFIAKVRDEIHFGSREALIAQIKHDVDEIRHILAGLDGERR
jgi:riboflavin kinase / FMN adenylyltransferase